MTENRRYLVRAGAAIAVVAAVSIGAIGIAAASSDDPRAAAAQPGPDPDGHNWGGRWGGGMGHLFGGDIDGILHGEVVLSKDGGGTETVLVQKGAVTAVSTTEVTVKSTDGFTTTYTVNADTVVKADDEVAKDEEVLVVAPKSGAATVLVDLTDVGWK